MQGRARCAARGRGRGSEQDRSDRGGRRPDPRQEPDTDGPRSWRARERRAVRYHQRGERQDEGAEELGREAIGPAAPRG